jgi:hypothetical protein
LQNRKEGDKAEAGFFEQEMVVRVRSFAGEVMAISEATLR